MSIDADRRVVLFSWSLSAAPRLSNVACLDAAGQELWCAHVPPADEPDCFVDIAIEEAQIVTRTFRGQVIRLDAYSGEVL